MRMTRWPRLWLILALALIVAVVYWPSTRVLIEQWDDFRNLTYTHGWVILAACVWLVFRSRLEIAAAPTRVEFLALLALTACVLLWLVCYRASVQDLHITILPALFWLAATSALGWSIGRLLIFPVLFFCFALPSWSQLGIPLQDLTVQAMRVVLALTGPSASIYGDLIRIPNGTFEVEEGCSGLHFMIVGLAVAALHGELRRDGWRTRVAHLVLMAGLALLANWIRVYVIIEAGYRTDMHSSLLRNHYWFGWGVFAVALFVFFKLAARFEPAEAPAAAAGAPSSGVASSPARADLAGLAIAVAVLVALPAASTAVRLMRPAAPLAAALDPGAPWVPAPLDINSSWRPVYPGADRQQRRAFTNLTGDTVEVFTVSYLRQRQGAKLVGIDTSLTGRELLAGPEQTVAAPTGAFRETEVAERALPHTHSLIWSRYETAGRDFASPFPAQLWYGINALVSNPQASLVALRATCRSDCSSARRALLEFAASAPASER
jgi:exosortase